MEKVFFFGLALLLAYGVGCMGRSRKIGFGWAFGLSLLNVFIGLIAVLISDKIPQDEIDEKKENE